MVFAFFLLAFWLVIFFGMTGKRGPGHTGRRPGYHLKSDDLFASIFAAIMVAIFALIAVSR